MLCEEILSHKSYESKVRAMSPEIAAANYQQEPIDQKGRLYSSFKTYDGTFPEFKQIKNYTDTDDKGSDFLCSIVYEVTFNNKAYVLDVLYTKDGMEVTEPKTAEMLFNYKVNVTDIESNSGGRGFAFQALDETKLTKIISKPWPADNLTVSAKIWRDRGLLIDTLHKRVNACYS